jgi:hypothetical protein
MQIAFADTATGCTITGTVMNSTTQQAVPLSTADLKTLIASLLTNPVLTYVDDPTGVVVARTDTGITVKTPTGIFAIEWSDLVTISGVCA